MKNTIEVSTLEEMGKRIFDLYGIGTEEDIIKETEKAIHIAVPLIQYPYKKNCWFPKSQITEFIAVGELVEKVNINKWYAIPIWLANQAGLTINGGRR